MSDVDKLLTQLKASGVKTNALKSVGVSHGLEAEFNKTKIRDPELYNDQVRQLQQILYKDKDFTIMRSKDELKDVVAKKLEQREQPQQAQQITEQGKLTQTQEKSHSISRDLRFGFQPIVQEETKQQIRRAKSRREREPTQIKGKHLLLDDYRLLSKIPVLKNIKQQLSEGKISQKEYVKQTAETLSNASKSNKTVLALINEIVEESIQRAQVVKQNVVDANVYEEQKDTSRKSQQQQQQIETKFSKPRLEQDGISLENKRVGAVLPTDLTHLQDVQTSEKISTLIKKISSQHPSQQQIQERLQSIHKKSTGRDLQLLQQNEVSLNKPADDIQNVREDEDIDPLYQEQAKSINDVVSDKTYQTLVKHAIDKQNLTEAQKQLAENVLLDDVGILNNLDMISDISSIVSKDQKGIVQKFAQLEIQGSDGKTYNIKQILGSVPKIVKMISDIQGAIDPTNTKLQDYKRTTQVFSTAIVKKETNQFKIKQGQAFMTRACC